MKISRKDKDALNTLITINIERDDFKDKVKNVLTDYRKKANIPGFRKGHVPMGIIKKKYEIAVTADEVNKLLQQKLDQKMATQTQQQYMSQQQQQHQQELSSSMTTTIKSSSSSTSNTSSMMKTTGLA